MTDAINMLKTAYKALDDKKAYDIKILDIKKISSIADYMVIADGTNKNQVQAMCDAVTEEMGKAGFLSKSIEGYSEYRNILLPAGYPTYLYLILCPALSHLRIRLYYLSWRSVYLYLKI